MIKNSNSNEINLINCHMLSNTINLYFEVINEVTEINRIIRQDIVLERVKAMELYSFLDKNCFGYKDFIPNREIAFYYQLGKPLLDILGKFDLPFKLKLNKNEYVEIGIIGIYLQSGEWTLPEQFDEIGKLK